MPYQKYKCPKCGHTDYVKISGVKLTFDPKCTTYKCRLVRRRMEPLGRIVQNKPKKGIERTEALNNRPTRRGTNVSYEPPVYSFMEGEDPSSEEDDDDDDDFFPPAREFNLFMRYTSGSGYAQSARVLPVHAPILQLTHYTTIGTRAGRGNTNSVMGVAINGAGVLSAQRHAGKGVPYKKNPKASYEWCHLIADSLGGPTSAPNLVAASYSANTYMAAIESRLQANSKVDVKIEAHCSSDYVAEYIVYKLRIKANHNEKLSFTIDADCMAFTMGDSFAVGLQIDDWLKKNKAPTPKLW